VRGRTAAWDVWLYGDDAEHTAAEFDADAFIGEAVEVLGAAGVDGVTSSSDYPGCLVAAFVAHELGLPGPHPDSVLRCSHKYYARLAQTAAVPEATPRFALIDPDDLDEASFGLSFPLFVKPVKSWFSQFARRVDSFDQLFEFVRSPAVRSHLARFVRPLDQLLARSGEFTVHGGYMLAEELLCGQEVTLEGFVKGGRLTVVGIVDSVLYANTPSFKRFDYPSTLGAGVMQRMTLIAERVVAHIGFGDGVFNIELFYDEQTDSVHIVEMNPRMCAQFADVMESVNGTNTYEILFALAAGDRPPAVRPGGRYTFATSFVFRHFEYATVAAVPAEDRIRDLRRRLPVTFFAAFYRKGQRLSDVDYEFDGHSYRYAVVNLAGVSRAALARDLATARTALAFQLRPP
jgi:biotin carboxylase